MKKNSRNKNVQNNILNKKSIYAGAIGIVVTAISFLLDKITIRLMNLLSFPTMNYIFILITTLGESVVFAFIALMLTAALFIYKKPLMAFIFTVASAFSVQWLLKHLIGRLRPFEVGLTSAGIAADSSSFPSGHTIMFFAIIPILGKNFPKLKLALWIVAILIGLSRMYLGVHYLSDVMAGAFLGYGIGWLFMKIEEKYDWKK
jgi:undecaprenyl-diphosphatase